jgi:hypothetical protein
MPRDLDKRNAYMRARYQDPGLRARHQELRRACDARRYCPEVRERQVARAKERRALQRRGRLIRHAILMDRLDRDLALLYLVADDLTFPTRLGGL